MVRARSISEIGQQPTSELQSTYKTSNQSILLSTIQATAVHSNGKQIGLTEFEIDSELRQSCYFNTPVGHA